MPAEMSWSSSQLQVQNEFGQILSPLQQNTAKHVLLHNFFTVPSNETLNQVVFLFITLSLKMGGKKVNVENKGEHKWLQ